MSKSSLSDKHDFDEKGVHAIAEAREVDEAARFAFEGVVDTTEGQRIRYVTITQAFTTKV